MPDIGTLVEAAPSKLRANGSQRHTRNSSSSALLVFPEVGFDDERQIAFTQTLGVQAFENNGVPRPNGEKQAIFKVSLDPAVNPIGEYLKTSFFWHLDGTMHEVPILASLLSARYLPPEGGTTEWANTYAHDALPESDKAALEGLRVVHANWALQRFVNPEPSHEAFVGARTCRPGNTARVEAPLGAKLPRDRLDGGLCRRHGTS